MEKFSHYHEIAVDIYKEVQKSVIGKDDEVVKVLMAICAGGNILINDIPGVGKTTMAIAFSKAMGLKCNRIQFTPDTMPSDITGFNIYNKKIDEFEYRQGVVFCNILIADEINRTSARTQSALLEVMEEGAVTVDGITRKLAQPFIVMATQNPYGSAGTQKLPDSQLDRFMISITLGYPRIKDEVMILKTKQDKETRVLTNEVATVKDIIEIQKLVKAVYVDDSLYEYVAKILKLSREWDNINQGISPRAGIGIISMAKACAFLRGHDYVLAADIQNVIPDVIRHRIVFSNDLIHDEKEKENIIKQLIAYVKVPPIK